MRLVLPVTALALLLASTPMVSAEEGGSGHYLPGSMASFVDGVPRDETLIVRYNLLYYQGEIDRLQPLPFAGLVAAGAEAESWANGLTLLWRPPIELGTNLSYAMSATIPLVSMDVSADVATVKRRDSLDDLGDIILMPVMLNYNVNKDFDISARLGIYTPTGDYEVGRLANTGKNFWTFEPAIGLMYFGQENGIEASLFTGIDFNTENYATNYRSGTQLHFDGTLAQHFPLFGGLAGVGASGYWYEQVSGDSG
ncbi:MAG: SphA family protein, partial [Verrucomicrobiales bacterium]